MCFSCEIEPVLNRIERMFGAEIDPIAFNRFDKLMEIQKGKNGPEVIKEIFNQKRKSKQFIQTPQKDNRIFPNYFAPVIIMQNNKRVIHPMRYRLRPNNSKEEIPSKYNVFNARIDSLESRKTWKGIFMKKHGLFPFKTFYEWVEDKKGRKKLIQFIPEDKKIMWAPCIYDTWVSTDGKVSIESFAIITSEPPPEVAEMGHDRCPIFLLEKNINTWLSPLNRSKKEMYEILNEKEDVLYLHSFAA